MSNTPLGNQKPTVDQNRLSDSAKQSFGVTKSIAASAGIGGDNISELSPLFNKVSTDVVYKGPHDSSIVLGRAREGSFNIDEGAGLKGHTGAAAIDLVVGRKAADESFDIRTMKANPDFATDAARIYISQKSDIDKSLAIPAGKSGLQEGRSAVGIKADGVRIVARESMKLVVGTDAKNSRQGSVNTKIGIELIAGDLEKASEVLVIEDTAELQILEIEKGGMQPIPLGINTAFALDQMTEKVDKLCAAVSTAFVIVNDFLKELSMHTHMDFISTYFGIENMPSDECIEACTITQVKLIQTTLTDIKLLRQELDSYRFNHLKPSGPYYINSKFHSLN